MGEILNETEMLFLECIDKTYIDGVLKLIEHNKVNANSEYLSFMLHFNLCKRLDKGNIKGNMHEIVKVLVRKLNFDINTSELMQKPILFYYLYYKEFELADELMELGCDVNIKVGTGNQSSEGWLMEPLICEFIQRMNPERDFPENFEEQISWLRSNGADETLEPTLVPFKKTI